MSTITTPITTADAAKSRLKAQFKGILTGPQMEQIINLFYCIEEAAEERGAMRQRKVERHRKGYCNLAPLEIPAPKRYSPDPKV